MITVNVNKVSLCGMSFPATFTSSFPFSTCWSAQVYSESPYMNTSAASIGSVATISHFLFRSDGMLDISLLAFSFTVSHSSFRSVENS
jgi:hypothetical protein